MFAGSTAITCYCFRSLQNRRILGERALNIPSSVYKSPSWIRKTLEAWGECKRTIKGERVNPNPAPFLALFHSLQLSTFCESKMAAKHSKKINNRKPTNLLHCRLPFSVQNVGPQIPELALNVLCKLNDSFGDIQ